MDYHLSGDGLSRVRDRIYLLDINLLKKIVLRDFHAKYYSSHLGYQKILIVVNNFYYWLNLKKNVVEFVGRFLDR